MHVVSNALVDQAEVVQLDRWDHGPLELVFLDRFSDDLVNVARLVNWNCHYRSGLLRDANTLEWVQEMVPALRHEANPNVFLVPCINGYTELHMMLTCIIET